MQECEDYEFKGCMRSKKLFMSQGCMKSKNVIIFMNPKVLIECKNVELMSQRLLWGLKTLSFDESKGFISMQWCVMLWVKGFYEV